MGAFCSTQDGAAADDDRNVREFRGVKQHLEEEQENKVKQEKGKQNSVANIFAIQSTTLSSPNSSTSMTSGIQTTMSLSITEDLINRQEEQKEKGQKLGLEEEEQSGEPKEQEEERIKDHKADLGGERQEEQEIVALGQAENTGEVEEDLQVSEEVKKTQEDSENQGADQEGEHQEKYQDSEDQGATQEGENQEKYQEEQKIVALGQAEKTCKVEKGLRVTKELQEIQSDIVIVDTKDLIQGCIRSAEKEPTEEVNTKVTKTTFDTRKVKQQQQQQQQNIVEEKYKEQIDDAKMDLTGSIKQLNIKDEVKQEMNEAAKMENQVKQKEQNGLNRQYGQKHEEILVAKSSLAPTNRLQEDSGKNDIATKKYTQAKDISLQFLDDETTVLKTIVAESGEETAAVAAKAVLAAKREKDKVRAKRVKERQLKAEQKFMWKKKTNTSGNEKNKPIARKRRRSIKKIFTQTTVDDKNISTKDGNNEAQEKKISDNYHANTTTKARPSSVSSSSSIDATDINTNTSDLDSISPKKVFNGNKRKNHGNRPQHHRNISIEVQNFIGMNSRGHPNRKRHMRRKSLVIVNRSSSDMEKADEEEDIDFEVSWAMFNYYSALGDPTRANGVNGNQWRSFCNSCIGLSNFISTAEMDLIFASAIKIDMEGRNAGEEMAVKTATTSSSSTSSVLSPSKKSILSRSKTSFANRSELDFIQFFYALHEASQKVDSPSTFVEDYLFPLASVLMHKLVSTSGTRRASVKVLLNNSNPVQKILKSNFKTITRLFDFYKNDSDAFEFASLLSFAKDFDIVPTLISHSILQKLMHDVKMHSLEDSDDSEVEIEGGDDCSPVGNTSMGNVTGFNGYISRQNRASSAGSMDSTGSRRSVSSAKKNKKVSQSELTRREFEEVIVGISQCHRHAMKKGELLKDNDKKVYSLKPTMSFSIFLDEDLINLLKHLEYGDGRRKMASRGQRENRICRFTSSEHFSIPKSLNSGKK